MAGETSTSSTTTAKAHSTSISLDEEADASESQVRTSEDSSAGELEELRAQNARYKQQMNGWQTQSQRNLDDRNAMAERLARLEGHFEAAPASKSASTTTESGLPKGKLASALQKWLDNDSSELSEVEEYLANAAKPRAHTAESDIEQAVTRTLQKFGTKSTLLSQIGRTHPEMGDEKSPLYGAVFDAYDEYAEDPGNKLFFPHDEQFMVPVPGPDGSKNKMMDARVVRQLISELKLAGGVAEGRRQEAQSSGFGTALSGNGRTTTTQRNRTVEAIELLTQGERDEMANLKMLKAWPASWPKDEKAASKMIFEGLAPAEKARRLAEYRKTR